MSFEEPPGDALAQLGRLTKKVMPTTFTDHCATGGGIVFTYDAASNLSTVCDAQGTVTYGYTNANELSWVEEPGGNCTAAPVTGACTTYSYVDASGQYQDGRPTQVTFPPSTSTYTTYTYDGAGNTTRILTKRGAATYQDTNLTWAKGTADQTLKQSMTLPSGASFYRYDAYNQLCWAATATSANACSSPPTGAYAYSYDNAGNRTTAKNTAGATTYYAYNAANELCRSQTTSGPTCTTPNFTYDGAGNNLTANTTASSWTYNAKGQAASRYIQAGYTVTDTYADADSTERTDAGGTAIVDTPLGIAAVSSSINITRTPKGQLLGAKAYGYRFYYLKDDQGTVVGLVDGTSGTQLRGYTYDPWGQTLTGENGGDAYHWADTTFRYASGYNGQDNKTTKFGTRYYDPSIGRWTQKDSLLSEPPYSYAASAPTSRVDPSGQVDLGFSPVDVLGDGLSGAAQGAGYGFAGGALVGCTTGAIGGGLLGVGVGAIPGCIAVGGTVGTDAAVVGAVGGFVYGVGFGSR